MASRILGGSGPTARIKSNQLYLDTTNLRKMKRERDGGREMKHSFDQTYVQDTIQIIEKGRMGGRRARRWMRRRGRQGDMENSLNGWITVYMISNNNFMRQTSTEYHDRECLEQAGHVKKKKDIQYKAALKHTGCH